MPNRLSKNLLLTRTNFPVLFSENSLLALPASLSALQNLRVLNVSHNQLTQWSPALGACPHLVRLLLHDNAISTPGLGTAPLGKYPSLQMLNLSNNALSTLPAVQPNAFPVLTKLYLGGNQLSSLSPTLSVITSLRELQLNNNNLSR